MSTPRTWLLIIALVILALGSGFYLFSPMRQSKTSATESPATIMTKSPVATPLSEENLPGPTPESQPPFTSAATGAPSYQYNAQGQLQSIRYRDGSVYTYRYDSHGDKISETNEAGRT
jgi:YD repeat-containing protein